MTGELAIYIIIALFSGIAVSTIMSLIPGLHIYNVIAITMTIIFGAAHLLAAYNPLVLLVFLISMTVNFSMLFTISTQYFQPCDDSFRFIMLPHEKYYYEGRAHEAVLISGLGGFIAIIIIAFLFPLFGDSIRLMVNLLRPHLFWMVGLVIVFILMSEWPKDHGAGKTVLQRFADGWIPLMMGYLSFFLAALLGMFIFSRTLVPVDRAFQSLMPVFVGLFAFPSFILTFITRIKTPEQHLAKSIDVEPHDVARGTFSGSLAGLFAGFTPGVTPGPALLLTGHMTVTAGDKQFMIAGGVARVMYYIGSIMLFFIPDIYLRRGGLAINISLFYTPETRSEYLFISAVVCLAGILSFLILIYFSRLCLYLSRHFSFKVFSAIGMTTLTILVFYVTGLEGMLLLAVSTFIGIVPNMWHTRRINLLAVLLVPIFLNMSSAGPKIAAILGLN